MTPEDQDRLEAITSALARMVRRQVELEQRLARLEAAVHVAPQPSTSVEPPLPAAQPVPRLPEPSAGAEPARAEPSSRPLETAIGLTWLSRIGVVTVVLALAFFFEYAFQNHWITEWERVVLGLACGGLALFFGERLWRGGQRTFAQGLTATGIAFCYLSFWAAFALYHLLAQPAAFSLMLLATGAAGTLALRYDGPAIAVLGLAGGYATPLLLESERDPWFVLSYTLLLNLAAAVAARARGWRWLEALALAGTVILYATQMPFPPPPGVRWLYTVFLLLYYGQFAAAPLPPVFGAAQLLAGLALAQVWPSEPGVLALALFIAIAGLAVADRRGWAMAVSASFAGFWLMYAVWRGQSAASDAGILPVVILTASLATYLGWPLWRAGYRKQTPRFQDLLVLTLHAGIYFGAVYSLLQTGYAGYEGLFAVAAAVPVGVDARLLWRHDPRAGLLAAGIAWAFLFLAAPIQFVGYRVTLAWALEGAAIAWIGMRLRQPRALYAAGMVFLLVLLRLAFVDSGMYSSAGSYRELVNARFLVFVISAFSLLAVAGWTRSEWRFALPAYVGGHAVLLWGLSLEVVGWAERTAAPQNIRSVASTSISVLAAGYAVALVAVGVLQRNAPRRILGVALIGIIVLKLYLYDVWLLGQFYRMTAFAILGVLLLLMSYFYSRFRRSVESWWRP